MDNQDIKRRLSKELNALLRLHGFIKVQKFGMNIRIVNDDVLQWIRYKPLSGDEPEAGMFPLFADINDIQMPPAFIKHLPDMLRKAVPYEYKMYSSVSGSFGDILRLGFSDRLEHIKQIVAFLDCMTKIFELLVFKLKFNQYMIGQKYFPYYFSDDMIQEYIKQHGECEMITKWWEENRPKVEPKHMLNEMKTNKEVNYMHYSSLKVKSIAK